MDWGYCVIINKNRILINHILKEGYNLNEYIKNEIENIKSQIIEKYLPCKVILFGSQAKGTARKNSDIDLCVIKNTDNKRELLTDMYLNIDSNKPFDIILYTEEEWEQCIKDSASFARLINKTRNVIYDT